MKLRALLRVPVVGAASLYGSIALAVTCPAGTYLPSGGSICSVAPTGYYATNNNLYAAPAGTYVASPGATAATVCPTGSYSYGAASACRAGSFSGIGTASGNLVSTLANGGVFGSVEGGTAATTTLTLSDLPSGIGGGLHITDLTLHGLSIVGGDGAFAVLGFTPGTVLGVGAPLSYTVRFAPELTGSHAATLVIDTDQNTGFGGVGRRFTLALSGTGVAAAVLPEPATWAGMIAGFALLGGVLRRRSPIALA